MHSRVVTRQLSKKNTSTSAPPERSSLGPTRIWQKQPKICKRAECVMAYCPGFPKRRLVWYSNAEGFILASSFGQIWFYPPPRKRPKISEKLVQITRKSSKLTLFRGGGEREFKDTKRFYGHLGVSAFLICAEGNQKGT